LTPAGARSRAARSADALEEFYRRLVVRVLRHQLAAKCLSEHTLIEMVNEVRGLPLLGGDGV
jgi:hypothetical protein